MERSLFKLLEGAKLISEKIVMITGAASGIGKACARMFSQQGALLALVDLDYEALQKTCKAIEDRGGKALAIKADVTREIDLDHVFQMTHDTYHGLNILINNVGGGRSTAFFEIGMDEWNQVIDLNLTSVFSISQRASLIFRKQGDGVIVNISSQAGRSVSPTAGCHYTSSKAAVLGLTRHMATILAPYNIRVNAVCPGITNSERIMKRLEAQGKTEEVTKAIPLGRIGDVYEVASCCLFLASDLSTYVTGATLDVNGGSLMI